MIYKYLVEIKYRAFFSFIAWSFLTLNCYFFKETLLFGLIKVNSVHNSFETIYFLITGITEVFMTYLQLAYFTANQIAYLFFCYQFFAFLSTGLYRFEYFYFKNITIIILVGWVIFVLVLNYIIFPASWKFFLQFKIRWRLWPTTSCCDQRELRRGTSSILTVDELFGKRELRLNGVAYIGGSISAWQGRPYQVLKRPSGADFSPA